MIIGIIIFLLAVSCIIGLVVIGLTRFFMPKKKPTISNPYIEAHKYKLRNDKMYDDYIDWLDKKGEGVPIPKIKSPEDIQAEMKINKMFK